MLQPTVLMLTSTLPRWQHDTLPNFIVNLAHKVSDDYKVILLGPHFKKARIYEKLSEQVSIFRFIYAIPYNLEVLCGISGILSSIQNNVLRALLVPGFILSQIVFALYICSSYNISFIHAHWLLPQGIVALVLKKMCNMHYVLTLHGADVYTLNYFPIMHLKKYILDQASQVNAVSPQLKNYVLNVIGSKVKIDVIPIGVDDLHFKKICHAGDCTKYKSDILYVGRLVEKKGLFVLIEALSKVVKTYPMVKLTIIGKGDEYENLLQLIAKLYLKRNISFIGGVPNNQLVNYYSNSKLFIYPSIVARNGDCEGLGLSLIEAGLCGCNLIGSRSGGIPSIISNNRIGKLVKPGDSQQLARAIIKSLKSPQHKKIYTRKVFIKKYSLNVTSKLYKEIYKKI